MFSLTFINIPISASVVSSEFPPKLIIGSGMPLVGRHRQHYRHIHERLHHDQRGHRQRQVLAEIVLRPDTGAQPRHRIRQNAASTPSDPANPHSSQMTA